MKKSKIIDFDPESLLDPAPPSSSEDEQSGFSGSEEEDAGREHYVDVGKSKLRKREAVPLGLQYTGTQISRQAAEDDDSDDPFARRYDEDGSEDGDNSDDGSETGIAVDQATPESDEEDQVQDQEELEDGEEGLEVDENMDDMEDEEASGSDDASDDSASDDEASDDASEAGANKQSSEIRDIMKDRKALTTTLAAAAQSDVAKGQAIKTQRKTFDSLLNTRVRLQKALISTNSMVAENHKDGMAPEASIEAAEAAALALLNSLTDLKTSMEEARTGQKRKRTPFTSSTASSDIRDDLHASETAIKKQRRAILEKWSAKTRTTKIATAQRQLNVSAEQTLTEVLDSQLTNSTHLIARTQTPRSCAPLQSALPKPVPDANIYDDADFYGLLLKELLEQRSADISNNSTAEFVVQAPWQVAREAKTKKIVDTKASKGRKLRYTVHEKLQNFMAPEERGLWGERQRDELFSSLFGQRLGLGEQDDVESEQEDAMDAEEQGLMLFRN